MDFTIIGAGKMGRGIATRLLSGGNSVVLMDRDNEEAHKLAAELVFNAKGGAMITAVPMGSSLTTDTVVLAVYYGSVPAIIKLYGEQLAGRTIVDITNPLNATNDDLATPPGSSGAEEIAKQAPVNAHVVKAFNTTFASTLVTGSVAQQQLDVFMAGDDAGIKSQLAAAFQASGLRPIDTGPLRRARQLEGVGLLHIALQKTLGTNWASAVKILP